DAVGPQVGQVVSDMDGDGQSQVVGHGVLCRRQNAGPYQLRPPLQLRENTTGSRLVPAAGRFDPNRPRPVTVFGKVSGRLNDYAARPVLAAGQFRRTGLPLRLPPCEPGSVFFNDFSPWRDRLRLALFEHAPHHYALEEIEFLLNSAILAPSTNCVIH